MVGRLMQFWGFKRPMGRIWTILYLSPDPLSAARLSQTLHMSAGGVSMALAELEKWECIHRTWIPGDRRDYFRAETDIWKMVRGVLRQRELRLVVEFGDTLRMARNAVFQAEDEACKSEVGREDEARSFSYKRERLSELLKLSEVGATLLSGLVAGQAIDPKKLVDAVPSSSKSDEKRTCA